MAVVINSGSGGDLNPGFGGSGGPVATAVGIARKLSLSSSTGSNILSAQVSYGYDQVSGSARIIAATSQGSIGDSVSVTMGAGTNNVDRFHGTLREFDTTLSPHSVSMVCKGPLYAIEEYENSVITTEGDYGKDGLALSDLVGTDAGATLVQIVSAVLSQVGIGSFDHSSADPAFVYGTYAPEEFTWGSGETAAAYLHRLFEASEGYRLFDSADGNVYLRQITAIPSGSADFTFTLGDDIFGDSSALDSSLGQKSAVLVTGYDDGSGPATSNVVGSGSSVFRVNSTMIETDAQATAVANFWLPVVNRRQQTVRLSTPRDMLLGPGQTIYVDADSGLATNGKLWLKSVTTEVSDKGFTQNLVCVVGS